MCLDQVLTEALTIVIDYKHFNQLKSSVSLFHFCRYPGKKDLAVTIEQENCRAAGRARRSTIEKSVTWQ